MIFLSKHCKECARNHGLIIDCMNYCVHDIPEIYLKYLNRYLIDKRFSPYPEDLEMDIRDIQYGEFDFKELSNDKVYGEYNEKGKNNNE